MKTELGNVVCERSPGARVFRLRGEFDLSNAWQIKEMLLDAIRDRDEVVVDLAEVSFMDASLVRALVAARRAAGAEDLPLAIMPPANPTVWRLISLADLPLAA
ncbi:MAG: STAS domain-containing protein [Thermoleophilaceae bacterium]